MLGSRRNTTCLAAALAALIAVPLSAGVVFEVETTYHSGSGGGGPEASQMSIESPNMKMEIVSGESQGSGVKDEVIWRGDRREMVIVDHREKQYMVFDGEAVKSMGGQVQQAMKEVEKMLEGLDPEQREMVEMAMKNRGAAAPKRPASDFRRTGERGTKAGYPCVRYDVTRGGEKIRELWVTDWSRIEGGKELMHVFESMAAFFEQMMDSLGDTFGGSGFMGGEAVFDGLDEIGGFPVVTRNFDGGELESETTLRSARRRTIDPAAFEPPSGYKRQAMF